MINYYDFSFKSIRCNTNIFTLLKSNYKYKRRCRVLNIQTSRETKNVHSSSNSNVGEQSKRVYDIKSKLSKFLKIFILIMNQLTSSKWTTQLLTQIKKIININYLQEASNHHKRMQSIQSTDDADVDNVGNEIINRNNYDKVSTYASTTSKCQRREYHHMPLSQTYKEIATTVTSITSFLSCTTNHHWMPMICHNFKYKTSIASNILYGTSSITKKDSCQAHDLYVNLTGSVRSDHCINSSNIYKNNTWSTLLMLFITLSMGIHGTAAGACWQTVLDNGKCNEIFSLNINKSECCSANQEFSYTDGEINSVEYFFATAIGGGMECAPCLESCKNFKCGPNKKCVKRKGRPKCICAPECGASKRKRKQREHTKNAQRQHHREHSQQVRQQGKHYKKYATVDVSKDVSRSGGGAAAPWKVMQTQLGKTQRDTRSLSSENTNSNLRVDDSDVETTVVVSNENQRKSQHIHQPFSESQRVHAHTHLLTTTTIKQPINAGSKNFESPLTARKSRLVIANVQLEAEKPTTRRLQILSNVRVVQQPLGRRHNSNKTKYEDIDPDYADDYQGEYLNQQPKTNNMTNNNNNNNNNYKKKNNKRRNDKSEHDSNDYARKSSSNQSVSRRKLKANIHKNSNNKIPANNGRSGQFHLIGRHSDDDQLRYIGRKHKQHHKQHSNPTKQQNKHNNDHNNKNDNKTNVQAALNLSNTCRTLKTTVLSSTDISSSSSSSRKTTSLPAVSSALISATPANITASTTNVAIGDNIFINHGSEIGSSSILLPSSTATTTSRHFTSESTSIRLSTEATYKTKGDAIYNNDEGSVIEDITAFDASGHPRQQLNDQLDQHDASKQRHPPTVTENVRPSHPVCGTDGRTYNTECQLKKRACRTNNENLKVAYRGHCKTTCNGVKCLNGLTCVEDQYTIPHCIVCKIECSQDDDLDSNGIDVDATQAVCGMDGKTYKSTCDINRMVCKVGRSIGVAYPGPCRGKYIACLC
uniref:Kazal-like domain-containing protein n=1 Tax=Glossina brevipalpis TaxID=37001 RepID=A0A1A9WQW1_9MUSC